MMKLRRHETYEYLCDVIGQSAADEAFRVDQVMEPLIHLSVLHPEEPEGLTVDRFSEMGVDCLQDFTPSMFNWLEGLVSFIDPDDPDDVDAVINEMSEALELSAGACHRILADYQETGGYVEQPSSGGFEFVKVRDVGYDWTIEAVTKHAQKYETRLDWYREHSTSYQVAQKNGWLDIDTVTGHMERVNGHDNNAVYGWKVITAPDDVDMPAIGKHLIKFGVTSQKLNGSRVKDCAKKNGMAYELIAICDTSQGDAPAFESALLGMGEAANMPDWIDGKTEFVVMSDEQLNEAKQLLGAA